LRFQNAGTPTIPLSTTCRVLDNPHTHVVGSQLILFSASPDDTLPTLTRRWHVSESRSPQSPSLSPTASSRHKPCPSPLQRATVGMFRRSFSTTARLLHKSNGKPPAQEPGTTPRLHETKGNATPKEHVQQDNNGPKGLLNPRSPDFAFAFANPRADPEQRSRSLLLLTAATVTVWLTETYVMPWGNGSVLSSPEQQLVDQVCVPHNRMQSEDIADYYEQIAFTFAERHERQAATRRAVS
jgi:hypothetical protein